MAKDFDVEHWRIRKIIHDLKDSANLDPDDAVIVYEDGSVTDISGEEIGSIRDEL